MQKPHTGKINCSKILKEHLFDGKNGKMLDIAIWPNKDGEDQYGNTHYITQSVSKEAREKGERGPIIGNIKMAVEAPPPKAQPKQAPAQDMHEDSVPF